MIVIFLVFCWPKVGNYCGGSGMAWHETEARKKNVNISALG
jgi:hypothetical protein